MSEHVPNFDSIVEKYLGKKDEYKENSFLLPRNPFNCCIVGMTGTGKTNLLFALMFKHMDFDEVVVVARDLEEDKYQFLRMIFDEIMEKEQLKEPIYTEYSDLSDLPEIDTLPHDGKTKLYIFDDLVNLSLKRQKKIYDYFIMGRKRGISNFYLAQYFTPTPKEIRMQCQMTILFQQKPRDVLTIHQAIGKNLIDDIHEFRKYWNYCHQGKNDFMTIVEVAPHPNLRLRKNLDEYIILE